MIHLSVYVIVTSTTHSVNDPSVVFASQFVSLFLLKSTEDP